MLRKPWRVEPKSERSPTLLADAAGRPFARLSAIEGINDNDLANTIVAAVNAMQAFEAMRKALRHGLLWSESDGELDDGPLMTPAERAFRRMTRAALALADEIGECK